MFLKYVSFLDPGLILRLDFGVDATIGPDSVTIANPRDPGASPVAVLSPWQRTSLNGFDASMFTATQSFVTSSDGTVKLPIFIVRRKASALGPRPTLLYGYGGFSKS